MTFITDNIDALITAVILVGVIWGLWALATNVGEVKRTGDDE